MPSSTVDLLADMVAIDSVNPSLVAGGAGEREMAAYVADWARTAGLEVDVLEATPGRPSVVVRERGTGGGRSLLVCGHCDTVSSEGMHEPGTRVDGDRLYGRGAYDMKAGLAAALIACREAAGLGLAGDVIVAAVADEEHASLGVQEVLETVRADAAIVTEPTELEVVIAHRGFVWSEIEVTGRAAHGSRPHLGVDAIVKSGPILSALGALDAELDARTHPLLGRGSVHASVIRGGEELSSYPARCVVGLERRTLPGESGADVEAELTALLEACRRTDPELQAETRTLLVREPFEVSQDAEIVRTVRAAAADVAGQTASLVERAGVADAARRTLLVREPFEVDPEIPFVGVVRDAAASVLGAAPRLGGASYWADAAFIAAAGIPTVMFGPAGEGAHAAEEWVSISSTETVARTLVSVAERVCA